MKPFLSLDLGYSDAENYKLRQAKDFFNRVFLRNIALDGLVSDDISFLIGEKGTGKTAYAVYLVNNEYKNISASLKYIRETDYRKFLELKNRNHLSLSDFTSIWKTILLLLLANKIHQDEPPGGVFLKRKSFALIQEAIDEYYSNAFSPEILIALQITDESRLFAELISKHLKAGGEEKEVISFTSKRFQTNLFYIEQKLSKAISSIRTSKRHTLFIDGIDIRPAAIPFTEYLDCIKGLANAVWSLNSDLLANIKDSGAQSRVVLLVRPDIFESIGLQNTNTKIRDNSVVLDWKTTYPQYRKSDIFAAIDRLLSAQQDGFYDSGKCWDYYFPFFSPTEANEGPEPTSFISFLRFSLFRPRDIIVMMDMLQNLKSVDHDNSNVTLKDFNSPEFRKRYAIYLLGEVKDHISFYYTKEEYEAFLKFFEFLHGATTFYYAEFCQAYTELAAYLNSISMKLPTFFESANTFLQFLYDLNVISYVEEMQDGSTHIHWCYRERNYANICPKIKTHQKYELHYGLAKALNLGKRIQSIQNIM